MPGTIQVSVMDFQGPPSKSTPPTFLKVSLGNREYQTSDTGDFSFPLTNLRDNLVIKLLDLEGNDIAHTGIQTMSIVQKVSWDEFFFFEEGGFVHLKIQFILNEEERIRIRLKREAAVKNKRGNLTNISEKYSDIASSTSSSITSSFPADRAISGQRVMNLVGSGPPETNSHHKKKSSFSSVEVGEEFPPHASEYERQKDQKGSQRINNSSSKSSPDNSPGGLFGQVLKIAIIVGFGVLVLITRKRELRKSKRETDELLLAASEFMDEQSTIEE